MGDVEVQGEVGRRSAWSEAYTEVETAERMMRWATTHHPMVVPLMQCERVLEICTGTGMLSGFLALSRVKVTSIDLDASVLKVADQFHETLGVAVESFVRDGTATGFEDDSFDAVYSQGLWEHFTDENIRNFATEGLRLAPVVYASVPSSSYPHFGRKGPGLVGNERFLKAEQWESILEPLGSHVSTRTYADWKISDGRRRHAPVSKSAAHHIAPEIEWLVAVNQRRPAEKNIGSVVYWLGHWMRR